MEGQVWDIVMSLLPEDQLSSERFTFSERGILEVVLWAVLCDRPMCWACEPEHWPDRLRPAQLPHPSTVSRRSRTSHFRQEKQRIFEQTMVLLMSQGDSVAIDGRPLVVGGASKDPDARPGRAVRGIGRGYKLHAAVNDRRVIVAYAIRPLCDAEQTVALELMTRIPPQFRRVVGDALFDSMPLHRKAHQTGRKLYTPLRENRVGRRRQPERLRLLRLLRTKTGRKLLHSRNEIERAFGQSSTLGIGFKGLPPWARRRHRVERWMWGKMVLHHCWLIQKQNAA
jgi:hypothetical protein